MRLRGMGERCMAGDSFPYVKFGPLPMPDINAIGLTMTSGSNTKPMKRNPYRVPARLFGQNVEPTRAAVQGYGRGVDLTGRGEERR